MKQPFLGLVHESGRQAKIYPGGILANARTACTQCFELRGWLVIDLWDETPDGAQAQIEARRIGVLERRAASYGALRHDRGE